MAVTQPGPAQAHATGIASGRRSEGFPERLPKPMAYQDLRVRHGAGWRRGRGQNETTRSTFFGAPGSIAGVGFESATGWLSGRTEPPPERLPEPE